MKVLTLIATILGLIADALTLIAYGRQGTISLPGNYIFHLTPTRIWIFVIASALATGYAYSKIRGIWPFTTDEEGRASIQALFIIGP